MKTGKSQPNSAQQPEAKPRRKRRTKAQILLDEEEGRNRKAIRKRPPKTSPISIEINRECMRQLQKSREIDPDASKYANTSKRASEKKFEGLSKNRPKTAQVIVSDKAIADILKNSSVESNDRFCTEEEPVYTPTIIRKFRPPKSMYQLQKEALQSRNFSSSSEVSVASTSTSTSRLSPPLSPSCIPSTPVAQSPSVPEPGIFEPSKPADDFPLLIPPPKIPAVSKYVYVNAWLAKQQATWCSKYTEVLLKMLKKDSLIATYKCMVKTCSFTTISPENFEKHICFHEKSLLLKEFLYYCPYCFIVEHSAASLMAHYQTHLKDKYSCSVCFYRSAEESSCFEHMKFHHSNCSPVIFECPLDGATRDEMTLMMLKYHRREFVTGIKCSGKFVKHLMHDPNTSISLFPACNLLFYLLDVFDAHMREHASKKDADITADMNVFKLNVMNNKVGMFQCLSCEFGTESRSESLHLLLFNLITHLYFFSTDGFRSHMQEHPSELIMACKRKSLLTEIDPHSVESTIIMEFPKRSDVVVSKFNPEVLTHLKNNENINFLCDL